ncbi:hypothetical protein WJX73_007520 [Symbiochloris irregularis]|uniref:Uncharacterized protein n=1 Tax=Symbiochloris irregularis TaxID=706552 RepID=A0AAW1NMG4_9CHLO
MSCGGGLRVTFFPHIIRLCWDLAAFRVEDGQETWRRTAASIRPDYDSRLPGNGINPKNYETLGTGRCFFKSFCSYYIDLEAITAVGWMVEDQIVEILGFAHMLQLDLQTGATIKCGIVQSSGPGDFNAEKLSDAVFSPDGRLLAVNLALSKDSMDQSNETPVYDSEDIGSSGI